MYCLVRAGRPIPADVLTPRATPRLNADLENAMQTIRRLLEDRYGVKKEEAS